MQQTEVTQGPAMNHCFSIFWVESFLFFIIFNSTRALPGVVCMLFRWLKLPWDFWEIDGPFFLGGDLDSDISRGSGLRGSSPHLNVPSDWVLGG